MISEILFKSDYVIITKEGTDFFIHSLKMGMPMKDFNEAILKFPQIKINNFMAIKTATMSATKVPVKFGESKSRVDVEISQDGIKAYLTLYVSDFEFVGPHREKLVSEIMQVVAQNGLKECLKLNEIISNNMLCNGKQILIAEGTKPINGQDSQIKSFAFRAPKAKVNEKDTADFYEIDMFNCVKKGDFLAGWTAPTEGVPGKTVRGDILPATAGKNYTINYDRTSVYEESEEDVTRLHALKDGAVDFKDNVLSIQNHMDIKENVNFKTGNIKFEGFLTIRGIVEDAFSVIVSKDVEILSNQGLGCIKEISSKEGNVCIKGGINGKGKSVITAKKNVFIKYAKDSTIKCEGVLNIGAYAFNCTINANEITFESSGGQIVGGKIEVASKINCASIGSTSEIPTIITVKGILREAINTKLEILIKEMDDIKVEMSRCEKDLLPFKGAKLSPEDVKRLNSLMNSLQESKAKLKEIESEKKMYQDTLKTRGDGEIIVTKSVYPNTTIMIKDKIYKVTQELGPLHLCYEDGQIKQL